jgi:hypothetical protein
MISEVETLCHAELTLLLLAPDPITKRVFHFVNLYKTYSTSFLSVISPPLFPRISSPLIVATIVLPTFQVNKFSLVPFYLFFVNLWGGVHSSAGYADT